MQNYNKNIRKPGVLINSLQQLKSKVKTRLIPEQNQTYLRLKRHNTWRFGMALKQARLASGFSNFL
jgi:hypothetical protein